LLILDEIATGLGKTGSLFNFQRFDLRPDMVCIAKAIGSAAMPLSAVVVDPSLDIDPGLNVGYYTNEKNPLGARAGLATLEIIEAERLVENARTLGAHAAIRLEEMRKTHGAIAAFRAAGLMLAVEFDLDSGGKELADLVYRGCVERGVIPMFSPASTVALSVPLVIDQRDLDECIDILGEAIAAASQ
jgi:4-aminobutyrate aminotransferase